LRFGRRADDGRITIHNDPRVMTQMTDHPEDFHLWDYYDAVTAKTLLLRGGKSIILSAETAAEMERRGPRPRIHLFEDIGHAPWLTTPGEFDLISNFLAA
jgi:pimeloyl-ACP methyl ester carboxylesterase